MIRKYKRGYRRAYSKKKNYKIILTITLFILSVLFGAKLKEFANFTTGEPGRITNSYTEDIQSVNDRYNRRQADEFLSSIPEYSGTPGVVINHNKPTFTSDEYDEAKEKYIKLSKLDYFRRCGTCSMSVGSDTITSAERGDISNIYPSGWHQKTYEDIIEDSSHTLYNRSHLLAYSMSGLNDEPRNLITGTTYMNHRGMLPYETAILNYIKKNGGRILYRVTPIFKGRELVARGVYLEAGDVETLGNKFHINVYCYNVQPGIGIDYTVGTSYRK